MSKWDEYKTINIFVDEGADDLTPVQVEVRVTYSRDHNYGADADGRGGVAVFGHQHIVDPLRRIFVMAHHDQAAHDVADHVVQKRVGFKFKTPVGAALGDFNAVQGFYRRQGLAGRGPE